MRNQVITEWWLALVWSAAVFVGGALVSVDGWRSPFTHGMTFGCLWGALLMRWSIMQELRRGQ